MIPFLIILQLVLLSQQGDMLPSFGTGLQDLDSLSQRQIEEQTEVKDLRDSVDPTLGSKVSSGFEDLTYDTAPEMFSPFQESNIAFSDTDDSSSGIHRIIGGSVAPEGSATYQASLRENGGHFCGGAILSIRWVVTAGHCLLGSKPGSIDVVVGTNSLKTGGDSYGTEKLIMHPKYDDVLLKNDIGMIRTKKDIKFSAKVKPINLPSKKIADGKPVVITGFGYIKYDRNTNQGTLPTVLQTLQQLTVNLDQCRKILSKLFPSEAKVIDASQICTFAKLGQGACKGDSGGPVREGNELHGIGSWSDPCGQGTPDVSTSVFYYKPWIESTMK